MSLKTEYCSLFSSLVRIHDLHTQTDTQLIRDQLNELAHKFFTVNILNSNLTRTLTNIRYYHHPVYKPIYFRTPIYLQHSLQINQNP